MKLKCTPSRLLWIKSPWNIEKKIMEIKIRKNNKKNKNPLVKDQ